MTDEAAEHSFTEDKRFAIAIARLQDLSNDDHMIARIMCLHCFALEPSQAIGQKRNE